MQSKLAALHFSRRALAGAFAVAATAVLAASAVAQTKVRVAIGDVLSTETLSMIIALERAKEKGVDYQVTHFAKEDLAIQAVINGQADVGVGTPYAVIQKSKAPLRIVFQGTRLVFFPVADKSYKTWKDMNGQPIAFHARATGTEAIGNIIAKREGIQFGDRSYVPGSENRIVGMMKGQIKATIVDLANKNVLMEKAGDRFHILPGLSQSGVRRDCVRLNGLDGQKNEKQVDTIVAEFLPALERDGGQPGDRRSGARQAEADGRPAQGRSSTASRISTRSAPRKAYSRRAVAVRRSPRPTSSSTPKPVSSRGRRAALKVEDFWNFAPLEKARKALGG